MRRPGVDYWAAHFAFWAFCTFTKMTHNRDENQYVMNVFCEMCKCSTPVSRQSTPLIRTPVLLWKMTRNPVYSHFSGASFLPKGACVQMSHQMSFSCAECGGLVWARPPPHTEGHVDIWTLVLFDEMTPTVKLQSLACRVILSTRTCVQMSFRLPCAEEAGLVCLAGPTRPET